MRKKKSVACFGLGRDQYPFVKEMSKDFIIHGFDINKNCYAKKLVDYFYNTPYSKKDKILYILKKKKYQSNFKFCNRGTNKSYWIFKYKIKNTRK